MLLRLTEIHQAVCVCILINILDWLKLAKGHNGTEILLYKSYRGTILSDCEYVASDVASAIECGRFFSESTNSMAFVYDRNNKCAICEILEEAELNTTGRFFMRQPTVFYPRQNKFIWIPGGLSVGQLIEVKTKVHFDQFWTCGICIVFYTGTAGQIGNVIPLALQVHANFTHVHGYTFTNGSLINNISNVTRPLVDFDQDFTTSFLVTDEAFKISIDDQFHFTYNHVITELKTIQYMCLNCITIYNCDYGILRDTELRFPNGFYGLN